VLDVAYQPGRWILGTSAVLALSGLAMQLVPRRQAWAMVQKSGDSTAVYYRDHNAPGDVSLRRAVATALGTGIEDISW
jgi:hypothetical protein